MHTPLPLDAVLSYPDAISQVRADGTAVYWLATIAAEDGRTTVRRMRDGKVADLTPDASVRSRTMEYGGGAYAVDAGTLAWCDDRTARLWVRSDDAPPRPITPLGGPFVYGGLVLSVADRAVIAIREDHSCEPEPCTEIVRIDLDGDGDDAGRVLATGADFYASVALADGRLAWQQWNHPSMSWDTSSVWTAPLDGSTAARPVCSEDDVAAGYPLWLPSGQLAWVSDASGFWNWQLEGGQRWTTEHDCSRPLWVLNPPAAAALSDDRIATLCYRDGRGSLAVWSPRTGEVSWPLEATTDIESVAVADDVILAVAEWADRGPSLVALHPDGSSETLVGVSHPDPGAVVAESVWAAGEAGPVHAWLYRPTSPTPPLLVMTHGGPTSMATAGYDMTIQFWVSRGFAVLDVNYSGSTGFGRAYRDRLKGMWGIYDVSDTVAAVRSVTDQGLADPSRVAITGGSAGGFTTLASLTSTDVYRAGISRYGIGDLTTLVTDTHKAESRYPESLIAPWPQGRAVYEDRSPVNHLDRLSTPMLILQGTEDKVVPPNQAVQMADAVRAAGQPVALLMLEGEGHGFRAMATRRLALEAQVSFLEQVFAMAPSPDVPKLPIENL